MQSPVGASPSVDSSRRSLSSSLKSLDLRLYYTARCAYGLLKHERKARLSAPLGAKLAMWRRGFFAESATIYGFPRNRYGDYLSDYQHFIPCSRINSWPAFFRHKLMLRSFLLAIGFRQAETVAVVTQDGILGDPYGPRRGSLAVTELAERLHHAAEDGYVVKPENGWCGEDIFLLSFEQGRFVRRRGRDMQAFDLDRFIRERRQATNGDSSSVWLIERRLQQGTFWARLFPDSANTIRLLTLWSPDEPAPFVARAVQRIGTADTVPTDNWSGGGISAPVDLETGTLGVGRMHPLKGGRADDRFTHHPDTGTPVAGATLPHWAAIQRTVLAAAARIPFNRMAGWDVLVTDDGTPVLLEANGNSDVNLLQVHGGLLAEPRIRHFYESFGVV